MKRPWIYFINPFLVITVGSYRKMKQIGDYTYSAVSAAAENAANPDDQAFFTSLETMLQPPVDAFDDVYTLWNAQQGLQKGKTRSLNDLLEDLRGRLIEDWDLAIQGVYRQGTAGYIALLPRHRTPFQSGKQLQRITAVGALSLAIGKDPKLQTLKTDIDTFYDQLVAANNSQKGSKSTKTGSSSEVEADRVALCTVLYGVLGLLMNHYKETPEIMGQFFLMELLRDTEQTEFTHALKGGETRLALTHTFTEGETITITNDGNTELLVALAATKNSPVPDTAISVKPGDIITLTPEQLGAKGNRFLMIKNMSATEAGDYTITLL